MTPTQELGAACLVAALHWRNEGADRVVEITTQFYNHIVKLSEVPNAPSELPASGLPFDRPVKDKRK